MSGRLVNLCFHGIGRPSRELEPGEDEYWIPVGLFHDVLDAIAGDPRVRLSFDDGNSSDLAIALPALTQRRLDATFFVLAGRFDRPGSLSRADARELAAAGMRIGSHGMDHVPWRRLDDTSLRRELVDARESLASTVERPIDEVALPLGRYDRRLLTAVRRCGYTRVHSSDRQWARPGSWLQPRFSVRRTDTVTTIRQNVLTEPSVARGATRSVKTAIKRVR